MSAAGGNSADTQRNPLTFNKRIYNKMIGSIKK